MATVLYCMDYIIYFMDNRNDKGKKNNSFIPLSYSLAMSIFAFGMILMCILGN